MTPLQRRLIANFGANTFGRISSVAIQIVAVPVLLRHWGAGLYGEWILLSTVPAYLAMSDIGFGNVAGNEMTMLVAAGKRQEALVVYQSVNLFILTVSVVMFALLAAGAWLLPVERWFQIRILNPHDVHCILSLLGLSSLLTLQEGLFQHVFRSVAQNALGTTVKSLIALASFAGVILAAELRASPLTAAMITAAVGSLGTFLLWRLLRRRVGWIRFGVRHARLSTVRRLWWPALSFMSFPVSSVLSLQGVLVVVGCLFGPVAVVTFSTARTISRAVLQAMQLINASVWPELSAAYGGGHVALMRKLHRVSSQMSIALCVGATLFMAMWGSKIWRVWTLAALRTDPVLLNLLLVQMLIGALWYTSSVVPAATNRHQRIAQVILAASGASLALSFVLMRLPFLGLRGAAWALIAGDSVIAAFVLKVSLRLTEDTFPAFVRSMAKFPGSRETVIE